MKKNSVKNIKTAFYLNIFFSVLEFIGGILTNSISILSDSIHDLGDSISIGISYLLEKKSNKKANDLYTYGYYRYSIFGALISSIVLLVGCVFVIYNSVPRLLKPQVLNYDGMIIFAIFGVCINGYAAYKTSKSSNQNEKAINLHMLEDVLGWIAVLIGSIIIKLYNIYIIDPILSLMISLYILFHVYKCFKEIFNVLMEKVPSGININNIKKALVEKFNEVKGIHHIHIWSLDNENNCFTAHVLLNENIDIENIIKLKKDIKEYLETYNINHSTLEIEYNNEECMSKKC